MSVSSLYAEMKEGLQKPLSADMPLGTVLLIFALFIIVAWFAYDAIRILSSWVAQAAAEIIP